MNSVSSPARNRARRRALLTAATVVLSLVVAFAQNDALDDMVRTEQRFAARALVVGWKQAFLEYFADSAAGFDDDQVVPESGAKSLRDTDAALTNALRSGQSEAYRGHLAEGARLHRPDAMVSGASPSTFFNLYNRVFL